MNELLNEQSTHLKQHQNQPIHWMPWGPVAFQKATDTNRPIFLSIGYASSHWCHVMANESFNDEAIAKYLNENFVCIKVDREELPDVDQYYQLACQVFNGRGGWPLSAFLTPDARPYFLGTYFGPASSKDTPSFMELIQTMQQGFHNEKEQIETNANKIVEALEAPPRVQEKVQFQGQFPTAAGILNALKNYQDEEFGGYGSESKFTHLAFYEWAIEQILEGVVPEEQGQHIIKSLERMVMGGVFDQARGGMHPYSKDKKWQIPQFEKMLYDQAAFLKTYIKASLIYPSPAFFDAIIQTLDYLRHEMLHDENYFFSSQDSDSEGVEGLYFGFSKDEFIDAIVQFDENLSDKMDDILKWFGITEKGNYQHQLNILSLNYENRQELYQPETWDIVRKVKQAVWEERKGRIPPVTNNKGVASWNFQIVSALIDVVQYSRIEAITSNATELLNKVIEGVYKKFLHFYQNGNEMKSNILNTTTRGEHLPLFENYVNFSESQLRFYEISGNKTFLDNGLQTLKFIRKEFFKDDLFFTRAIEFSDAELYKNIHVAPQDTLYKSSLGTYLMLIRKWSLLPEIKDIEEDLQKSIEELKHLCLQNPLVFGEMLRAFVYPDEAYRRMDIPKLWIKKPEFQKFFPNFSIRFLLNYTDKENGWEIHTKTECELKGESFEEFLKVFSDESSEQN